MMHIFHNWSKWEEFQMPVTIINQSTGKVINGFKPAQKRVCKDCGKIQIATLSDDSSLQ